MYNIIKNIIKIRSEILTLKIIIIVYWVRFYNIQNLYAKCSVEWIFHFLNEFSELVVGKIMNFRLTLYFSRWGHSRNPTVGCLSTVFDKRKATSPGGDSKISSLTFAFGVVDISHRARGLAFLPRDRKGASSNERPASTFTLYARVYAATWYPTRTGTHCECWDIHIEIKYMTHFVTH